jgi:LmbE family N-acetylglucosaminyl deacetylase
VETAGPYLVLAPHQDDEAIGAGGTLLLASKAGAEIHILFVTDGAQNLGGRSPAEMVEIRSQEADEVCRRLGATRHDLGIDNVSMRAEPDHVRRLGDLVREIGPGVILTPWLLDYPDKHRMVNHLLHLAHEDRALPDGEVWGYQVHNGLIPNACVEISEVAEEKRELIRVYQSQIELVTAYDHLGMGLSAWNSRFLAKGRGERYAEIFTALPMAEFQRLAARLYGGDLSDVYSSYPGIVDVMKRLSR